MPAMPLDELNRQIAQRERELKALRQELESRRDHYSALTRRKDQLLSQLRQVESEIAALGSSLTEPTKQSKAASPKSPSQGPQSKDRPRLSELILTAMRESGKAMTARQLSEEVRRHGFPLSGKHPVKSVESRLQEMKHKNLVQRATGQPGYILASSSSTAKSEKPKNSAPAPKSEHKAAPKPAQPTSPTKTAPTGQHNRPLSLRQALTNALKNNSGKYLSGGELADLVLASGYKTKSTKFKDAVWSMLGQMDNVEHAKGKGYRLKKT